MAPVEKIPAAVCLVFSGDLADARDGAGAILRRGFGSRGEIARDFLIFLAARASAAGRDFSADCARGLAAAATTRRRDSSSVLFVVARAVRPSIDGANGDAKGLLGDVLVNGVIGEAGERVGGRRRCRLRFRPLR